MNIIDIEKEVLELHSHFLNSSEIAKKLNIRRQKVYKILKKYDLKSHNKKPFNPRLFTEEEIDFMIGCYNQGMTCEEIYNNFFKSRCSSYATIQSLLSRRVKMRSRGKRINFNENFFEIIDTERKAYWLGFIYADGNVCGNRLRIEIMRQDSYLLYELRNDLEGSNKVCTAISDKREDGFKEKNNAYIGFCSDKLTNDLYKLGVVENKTFKLKKIPNIRHNLVRHFIRGYFDGDGTVYIDNVNHKDNRSIFGFLGQHDFLEDIKKVLISEIELTNRKIFDKETVSQVTFSKKTDIINFYNYIYKDATVYLKRKKDKFDIYLKG